MENQLHDIANNIRYGMEDLNVEVIIKLVQTFNDFTSFAVNIERILSYVLNNNISLYKTKSLTPDLEMFRTRIVVSMVRRFLQNKHGNEGTCENAFFESLKQNAELYIDLLLRSLPETVVRNESTELLGKYIDNIYFVTYGNNNSGSDSQIVILVRPEYVPILMYCKNAVLNFLNGNTTPKAVIDDVMKNLTVHMKETDM